MVLWICLMRDGAVTGAAVADVALAVCDGVVVVTVTGAAVFDGAVDMLDV
jgi:hypothetical protein